MKVARKLWTWALALVATFALVLGLSTVAYAAAGEVPDHEKILTQNDDGTYTIALNVTGDSEKKPNHVNVIVIFDTSSSMNTNTGNTEVTYTPTSDTGGWYYQNNLYGLIDGEYHQLTRTQTGNWPNITYHFWYNGQEYTGQRYTRQQGNQTRLQAAEEAVNSLASSLLAYNTQEGNDPDTVEMAFVDFANTAVIAQQPTTDYSTFEAVVNSRDAGNNNRGTNWEAGLRTALNVDFDDEDPTYVIFVSDGNPTFYLDNNGNRQGTGQEGADNVATCYNQAVPAAEAIVDAGYEFYTIGIYGSLSRMQSLTTDAGAPAENYYSAEDTAALQAALAEILKKIEMSGIGNASLTDGTTSSVTTTTGEVSNLLTVDTDSYKYYRAGGTEDGEEKYDSSANNGLGVEWADAPAATFENGAVKWDLSDEGVLENDVTYTVTFDCWPSQTTLDIVADIKNNPSSYNDLDENIKKYITPKGDLATNTTATLSYTDTRTGESNSSTYVNPDSVGTTAVEELAVSKKWQNAVDGQQSAPITLEVMRDTTHKYDLVLSSDNNWKGSVFVSIGIMRTDDDGNMEILEPGHDFTFVEPENIGYRWELDVPTVHPMLIDGELTTLVKIDAAHPAPAGADTYTINGATYYADEAGTAALTATNYRRSQLELTKVLEGDAPEDATFPFTISVTNSKASEGKQGDTNTDYYVWFTTIDDAGENTPDVEVSGATRESEGSAWFYAESGATITVDLPAGYKVLFINLPKDSTYTIEEDSLETGYIFKGSELSGAEDEDFEVEDQTSTGTIADWNSIYTVTYTNEYALVDITVDKVWDDASDQDGIRPKTLTLTVNGLPTGTTAPTPEITKSEDGNTWTYTWKGLPKYDADGKTISYTVTEGTVPEGYTCDETTVDADGTITNKHTPEVTTISVEKIWEGPVATATITLKAGDEVVGTITLPNEGKNTYTWENLPKKADGEDIVYTVSEDLIANYATTGPTGTGTANDPFTFTNKNTETVTVTATKVWDDSNNIGGIRPKELELTVNGLPTGTTAPTPEITKSEVGNTWTYTWTGLPKYASNGTALTYTVSEDAVPSGYTKSPTDPVSSGGTITNTYSPKTTTAEIKAGKKLDVPQGLDGTDVTGKYTLTLEANEGVPMPQGATTADGKQTVSIQNKDGNGTMDTFGEITYTTPGVYQYKVSESGTVSGVTNGTDSYTVLVTVADNGSGELVATVKIGEEESNEVLFTNTYSASSTSASFEVTKVLEGAELAAGAYSFELKEGDKVLQTKTNGADGSVKFDAIAYTAPGEFTYTISEVAGDKDYIEYDDHSVTVKVTVEDNGEGSLVADVTYTGGETFTNTYSATGEVEFSVAKEYNRAFEGGEFTFELKEGDEVLQTKSNDADGSVKFDAIEYTLDDLKETTTVETTVSYKEVVDEETGTTTYVNVDDETDVLDELPDGAVLNDETGNYDVTTEAEETTYKDEAEFTYTISEVAGDKDYIEYDTHEVTVTVTVKDNGEGKLEATASFDGETEFINTYSASGSITLEGIKKLEGRELQEGQFTFQLLDKDNNVLGTATNGADGTFKFEGLDALTFDETDDGAELTFYIAEVNDNKTGYTYDTHKCKVTVTVTDNGNGTMSATAEYDDGDTAVFNNKFAPLPVSIDPPVKKVVEGNPQTPATFTFQMKALTDGAPMPDGSADGIKTVAITGTGSYEFGDIVYTAPGKWEYEVSELNGGVENYTYDSTKYTITVTVSEDADGDGYLDKDVVITGGNGEIVFTNVYKPPVPKTGDATPQAGMLALAAAVVTGIAAFGARRRED